MTMMMTRYLFRCTFFILSCASVNQHGTRIDRYALVTRHDVVLNKVDTLGALSVGNGEFAFTVDVTGLQTYPKEYENGIPLGTQSQWGWHRIPGNSFSLDDVATRYQSCDGSEAPYAVQHSEGAAGDATKSLRANPHRLHLGLIGLILLKENGDQIELRELRQIQQRLNLWTGKIESEYQVEGVPVKVILYAHQRKDQVAVQIETSLISKQRLAIRLNFPYGKECHVCPGYDFENAGRHITALIRKDDTSATIRHRLDSTEYFVQLNWSKGIISEHGLHVFKLTPQNNRFQFTAEFTRSDSLMKGEFSDTEANSIQHWKNFWSGGGAIDFSACTDPRSRILEQRVVHSQYLTRIQCAGSMPPQETGLTMNSWFGKFHLEMHWWHAAQFSLWGRDSLLARSMAWYQRVLPKAQATARWQGYAGARWQKMTDADGDESPSSVGAFIIWQQPHPIYFAELLYRNNPSQETLNNYKDLVFKTAEFMASFVRLRAGQFHLCHPLIPAQEIFKATQTDDPAFELQYWYYGLSTAQSWRKRLGMTEDKQWKKILEDLAPLTVHQGLYLPNATTPDAYINDDYRRDHPAVLGSFGFLPLNARIDTAIMRNTFRNILTRWQWETTWGWDYPLMAMTAARLNKPDDAVNALLMDVSKNTYLVNGHNYQDKRLRLYLPGNGGLLAAVAMMAAGWDGSTGDAPGFPKNGKWEIKWEGLSKMP